MWTADIRKAMLVINCRTFLFWLNSFFYFACEPLTFLIISRREGDYEMMPVCACVHACVH